MKRIANMAQLGEIQRNILSRRDQSLANGTIEIKVSMATCAIAAGSKGVLNTFLKAVEEGGLAARVSQTGCMGYCYP